MRKKILLLIEREIQNAKDGREARITAKMNSLLDTEVIQGLYKASMAGVKINLIVRGICALRPGIRGISDNIYVCSVVGRFLEHPRVYIFYNGGEEEFYLSSADWMTRNLDRRVELLFPIQGREEQEFIRKILDFQFSDNVNAWQLNSDGKYVPIRGKKRKDSFDDIYDFVVRTEKEKQKEQEKGGRVFRPLKSPSKSAEA